MEWRFQSVGDFLPATVFVFYERSLDEVEESPQTSVYAH